MDLEEIDAFGEMGDVDGAFGVDVELHDAAAVGTIERSQLRGVVAGEDGDGAGGRVGVDDQVGSDLDGLFDREQFVGGADGAEGVGFTVTPDGADAVVLVELTGGAVVAGGGEEDVADLVDSQMGVGLEHQSHDAGDGWGGHGGAAHGRPDVAAAAVAFGVGCCVVAAVVAP